ncbi:MAG: sulfotransferase [Acidimicrobiia bacterium]
MTKSTSNGHPEFGEVDLSDVVFIMGTARSGSTLLGSLLGGAPDVFYAGELADWPTLMGASTVPRSIPFWEKVRRRTGAPSDQSSGFKRLFEHPAGWAYPFAHRRLAAEYERLAGQVLQAVAAESGCRTVVDSSHYPRRARALRRILGPNRVRLVYLVRRPSSIVRSFRSTGDKGYWATHLYLLITSLIAWPVYLAHPRSQRTIVTYEELAEAPLEVGRRALGRPLIGVDPNHLPVPLVLIGNRFVKFGNEIKVEPPKRVDAPSILDRLTDLVQWPFLLARQLSVKQGLGGEG